MISYQPLNDSPSPDPSYHRATLADFIPILKARIRAMDAALVDLTEAVTEPADHQRALMAVAALQIAYSSLSDSVVCDVTMAATWLAEAAEQTQAMAGSSE